MSEHIAPVNLSGPYHFCEQNDKNLVYFYLHLNKTHIRYRRFIVLTTLHAMHIYFLHQIKYIIADVKKLFSF